MQLLWAGSIGMSAAGPALAADGAAPFAIADDRLKGVGGPDPCSTDVTLSKEGSGYLTAGLIHRERGKNWIFCSGARHTWKGISTDVEGAIKSIESDADDPLVFEVDKGSGYVYQRGTGTIVLSDGTSVSLPPKPPAAVTKDPATSRPLDTAFGALKAVERRSRFPVVTFSSKGRHREIRKAPTDSEFIVLSFGGSCQDHSACQTDVQWAKSTVVVADGVTLERTGGKSALRDGTGKKYEASHLNIVSQSRRELGFDVSTGVTDLVWVDGDQQIPLAPLMKAKGPGRTDAR